MLAQKDRTRRESWKGLKTVTALKGLFYLLANLSSAPRYCTSSIHQERYKMEPKATPADFMTFGGSRKFLYRLVSFCCVLAFDLAAFGLSDWQAGLNRRLKYDEMRCHVRKTHHDAS